MRDDRRFAAALFLLALCVRLAFLALWIGKGLGAAYGRDVYYELALSWLGRLPPPAFDATHPPLYTLFIAGLLGASGAASPLPVLLAQAVLGAATALLVWRLGHRLAGPRAGRLAGLWAAVDPPLVFFAPHLQTETLFVALEAAFFLGLVRLWDEPPSWRHAALGLWGGLAALCRSVFGAYPAFLFLALWRSKGLPRALALAFLVGAGWAVPTGLWTWRNLEKYGRLVPMSAQMGWTLYEGFTLDREEVRRRPFDMAEEAARLGLTDPLEIGAHFAAKTASLVRERPGEALKIALGKAVLYWRPWPYDPHSPWQRGALGLYYALLFALAAVGARAAAARGGAWPAVGALFAYLTALHAVFFTSLRYRLPLEPFLCILAASGALSLWRRTPRALDALLGETL